MCLAVDKCIVSETQSGTTNLRIAFCICKYIKTKRVTFKFSMTINKCIHDQDEWSGLYDKGYIYHSILAVGKECPCCEVTVLLKMLVLISGKNEFGLPTLQSSLLFFGPTK